MRRPASFIARALSRQSLVALPGAAPGVDLPSISRVTKLPLEQLEDLAMNRTDVSQINALYE